MISKFKRFSNVADETSAKLLISFLECEVLVVVPYRYDLDFSLKTAERKCLTKLIYKKLKLLITEKSQRHLKVTLGIRTIKPTW